MTEETKRKQMSTSTSLGTSQMKTFAGRGISVSRPSLSSHSIYLNSADIDAVLTIATNHPWRCTLCLASHCSSLATSLHRTPPSPSACTNQHQLARCARCPQRRRQPPIPNKRQGHHLGLHRQHRRLAHSDRMGSHAHRARLRRGREQHIVRLPQSSKQAPERASKAPDTQTSHVSDYPQAFHAVRTR